MAAVLSRASLTRVARELDETAVAVSVMGTRRKKLKEMAALTEPIAGALIGIRPEVEKVRREVLRAAQNVKVSSEKARPASEKLRALAAAVRKVESLVAKRLGDVDPAIDVGEFIVANVWGYNTSEIRPVVSALQKAGRTLDRVGLPSIAGGAVALNPEETGRKFVVYDKTDDALLFDAARSGGEKEVLEALGGRLWWQEFGAEDFEVFRATVEGKGGFGAPGRFQEAFAALLSGDRVDKDMRARLQVTVGKLAARWPATLDEVRYEVGTVRTRKSGDFLKIGDPSKWTKVTGSHGVSTDLATAKRQREERAKLAGTAEALIDAIKNGVVDKKTGKVHRLARSMDFAAHVMEMKSVRRKHAIRLEKLKDQLGDIAKRVDPDAEVHGRLKEAESILGKLVRKPDEYKRPSQLADVTGTRVIHSTQAQVDATVQTLKAEAKASGMQVLEVEDKAKSKDFKKTKYRSYHLSIKDKDGFTKEVQVRTRRQDKWANWAHDIYKPTKKSQEEALKKHADTISDYGHRMSDHFFGLDTGKDVGKPPPCPQIVRQHFGCL